MLAINIFKNPGTTNGISPFRTCLKTKERWGRYVYHENISDSNFLYNAQCLNKIVTDDLKSNNTTYIIADFGTSGGLFNKKSIHLPLYVAYSTKDLERKAYICCNSNFYLVYDGFKIKYKKNVDLVRQIIKLEKEGKNFKIVRVKGDRDDDLEIINNIQDAFYVSDSRFKESKEFKYGTKDGYCGGSVLPYKYSIH